MPFKRILLAVLLVCFTSAPLWAQTGERIFTDYVGKSMTALIANEGAPQIQSDPPYLIFLYLDKPMLGRAFDVAYTVLGNHVLNVHYSTSPEFTPAATHFNPGRGFTDYLGKSARELLMLEGPPMVYMSFPEYNVAQLSYEKIDVGGKLYSIVYELEDDAVITVAYHYEGDMPADKIRPFVKGLDSGIMKNLGKPLWILGDSDEQPASDNVWRYLRMASGTYNAVLIAAVDLDQNSLVLDLGFQSRQIKSPRALQYSGEHELRMLEMSQYVSHSDDINKLLETEN